MTRSSDDERRIVAQGRLAALVVAGTMLLWMGAQVLGRSLGLPVRFAFLFDLAEIAALVWALFVAYQVVRARRGQARSRDDDKD